MAVLDRNAARQAAHDDGHRRWLEQRSHRGDIAITGRRLRCWRCRSGRRARCEQIEAAGWHIVRPIGAQPVAHITHASHQQAQVRLRAHVGRQANSRGVRGAVIQRGCELISHYQRQRRLIRRDQRIRQRCQLLLTGRQAAERQLPGLLAQAGSSERAGDTRQARCGGSLASETGGGRGGAIRQRPQREAEVRQHAQVGRPRRRLRREGLDAHLARHRRRLPARGNGGQMRALATAAGAQQRADAPAAGRRHVRRWRQVHGAEAIEGQLKHARGVRGGGVLLHSARQRLAHHAALRRQHRVLDGGRQPAAVEPRVVIAQADDRPARLRVERRHRHRVEAHGAGGHEEDDIRAEPRNEARMRRGDDHAMHRLGANQAADAGGHGARDARLNARAQVLNRRVALQRQRNAASQERGVSKRSRTARCRNGRTGRAAAVHLRACASAASTSARR